MNGEREISPEHLDPQAIEPTDRPAEESLALMRMFAEHVLRKPRPRVGDAMMVASVF